jgi:hypothetical protein
MKKIVVSLMLAFFAIGAVPFADAPAEAATRTKKKRSSGTKRSGGTSRGTKRSGGSARKRSGSTARASEDASADGSTSGAAAAGGASSADQLGTCTAELEALKVRLKSIEDTLKEYK